DGTAGQGVEHVDEAGNGEVGHGRAAEVEEGDRVEVRSRAQHQAGLHLLLPEFARHAEHGDVGHRRVADDGLLHLPAGDVHAPAAEVVGLAVDEDQVSVGVEAADVTGVEPQVPPRVDRG